MTVLAEFTGDSGTVYEVREGADGKLYCSCPGWRFSLSRRQKLGLEGRDCKHLEAIREMLTTPEGIQKFRAMKIAAKQ